MWVDYRGPLRTVYNDGEISTCGLVLLNMYPSCPIETIFGTTFSEVHIYQDLLCTIGHQLWDRAVCKQYTL